MLILFLLVFQPVVPHQWILRFLQSDVLLLLSRIGQGDASFEKINAITTALDESFTISAWLLLPALLVIVLAVKRMPPIPSLFAGVLAGAFTAIFAQGSGVHDVLTYANSGYSISTNVAEIDSLLKHWD